MDSEVAVHAKPKASGRSSLPRFPVRWAVENAAAARNFSRLLWLLLPLQYYVVTNLGGGLSPDDLIPAVSLTLISALVIFLISCVAAWLGSAVWPLDPAHGDTFTARARVWVAGLMIGTAGAYFLLAVSLAMTRAAIIFGVSIYGDLVSDGLTRLLRISGLSIDKLLLLVLVNLIYAFIALALVSLIRRRRPGPAKPADVEDQAVPEEPGAISIGLIVAIVMTVANSLAVLD